jgi:cytochrome P450
MQSLPPPKDALAAATHPDPYPFYAGLLGERPLYRDTALGMWVASSAQAVTEIFMSRLCRVRPEGEPVPAHLGTSAAGLLFGRLVRMNDGQEHARLKRAVLQTLGSIEVAHAEALSRACAYALASERLPGAGTESVDDFVFQLPVHVLGLLLGLPPSTFRMVAQGVEDYVGAFAPGASKACLQRASAGATALLELFGAQLASSDANGLLARLQEEALGVGPLGRDVVVANAIGFLSQAYEATAGLTGNTLLALAAQPALALALHRQPPLLDDALAEVLRHDPPVQNTRRFVAADGVVAGEKMQAGDVILLVLAAANRDPLANPEPHRFEVCRQARRTFGFGSGLHLCPGQALSMAIARAAVERVLCVGVPLGELRRTARYRPSFNLRIPRFGKGD